ncbi:uncharacterized protein LOC119766988 [Culex quinquefasciatus]|uniref:uncharacterized protein LOC119766988 n=1 Tax=Culex quinquefasciatus TaxID=7176 RepID=UPI0018E3BE9C|nr:uncharacterized protein LOC119766988 [Culex quinquefasciatus]
MSFECLPLEILQAILDFLTFEELLGHSLVCRRWSQAAASLVSRRSWLVVHAQRARTIGVLQESQRNYTNVLIHQLNQGEPLESVLDVCSGKIRLRRLKIDRAPVDTLYWFSQLYTSWLEHLEEVHISLDHRYLKQDTCSGKSYNIALPKLKALNWSENHLRRGNRTVTIKGPRLRKVSVNDSFGSKLNLILPDCDTLDTVECTLYRKNFSDIFKCSFTHLNTLILRIYNTVQSVEFLTHLKSLKRFSLSLEYEKELLPTLFVDTVDTICEYKRLEALQLHVMNNESTLCCVSLSQLAESLARLKKLELNNVCLKSTNKILDFQQLSLIKLTNIVFKNGSDFLVLDYPKLQNISVSVSLLPKLVIQANKSNDTLFVNLDATSFAKAVDLYLVQFLQRTDHIRRLVLFKTDCYDTCTDGNVPHATTLGVESLSLVNLNTSLECVESVGKCSRLKHLYLSKCSLSIPKDSDRTLLLDQLDTLSLQWVQLDDRTRKLFPIVGHPDQQIIGEEVYSTLTVFNTVLRSTADFDPLGSIDLFPRSGV